MITSCVHLMIQISINDLINYKLEVRLWMYLWDRESKHDHTRDRMAYELLLEKFMGGIPVRIQGSLNIC